jgi:hypothetical protein
VQQRPPLLYGYSVVFLDDSLAEFLLTVTTLSSPPFKAIKLDRHPAAEAEVV